MERDAGRDTRTAVGDELSVGERRQRLVPRRVRSARDPARRIVDLVRLAAPAVRGPARQRGPVTDRRGGGRSRRRRSCRRSAHAGRTRPARSPPLLNAARLPRRRFRRAGPRSRRGRSGGAATRDAPGRPRFRRRRRTRPARSPPGRPRPQTARGTAAGDVPRSRARDPTGLRPRRGTRRRGCARRDRARARAPGCRAPTGSPRTGRSEPSPYVDPGGALTSRPFPLPCRGL